MMSKCTVLLVVVVSLAAACSQANEAAPTSPTSQRGTGSSGGSFGTFLTFDFPSDLNSSELTEIQTGIRQVQEFLNTDLGGDIPINTQMGISVKIVASGAGNPEAGGSCCGALTASGARLFFDVQHPALSRSPGGAAWSAEANKEKAAAHEYVHAWAWSLGGLSQTARPLGDWLNEGLAEYIAYASMIRAGAMNAADIDRFALANAISTGVAGRCLSALESSASSGGASTAQIGYVAVKKLVSESANGILSLRSVNQAIGSGASADQAFQQAFGTSRQQFYNSFPAYLSSLGGPASCN